MLLTIFGVIGFTILAIASVVAGLSLFVFGAHYAAEAHLHPKELELRIIGGWGMGLLGAAVAIWGAIAGCAAGISWLLV